MPRFEMLIFDWDGTLMDSTAMIARAIQQAFVDCQLPQPSDHAARQVIGLGLADALQALHSGLSAAQMQAVAASYRSHYFLNSHTVPLFEGVEQALPRYREAGYLLAVATGKSRRGLDEALAISGLGACLHASRCADETRSKPHPLMLEELLDCFNLQPEQALMVGDTTHDLNMAHAIGMPCVALVQGAHDAETLASAEPTFCFSRFKDFDAWLNSNHPAPSN